MPNYFRTSTGERITDATIKKRLSQAYREKYGDSGHPPCEGCGHPAQGSAHIIPKARLKTLGLSDLIYAPFMFFSACYSCNSKIENPKGEGWKDLCNLQECLSVIEKYDKELYSKFVFDCSKYNKREGQSCDLNNNCRYPHCSAGNCT